MLLAQFAPWAMTPLLMLGGAYLCFEGAEKVFHALAPHGDAHVEEDMDVKDPAHLEEEKVRGAIKTDFILSAEIMTISLAAIEVPSLWMQAVTLGVVGLMITAVVYGGVALIIITQIMAIALAEVADEPIAMQGSILLIVALAITVAVYGVVALIVKMDDVGLHLASTSGLAVVRGLGRGLVQAMPKLMKGLSIVGTAAMLWVGGNIVTHGLHELGQHWPYEPIHHLAEQAAHGVNEGMQGLVSWAVTAGLDGVFGLVFGLILIPVVLRGIVPLVGLIKGKA